MAISLIIAGTYGFAKNEEIGVVFGIVCVIFAAIVGVYEAPLMYQIINNLLFT